MGALAATDAHLTTWTTGARAELELQARPLADRLYHLLAASLLLAEGQVLRARRGDFRKFIVAACYVRRWLRTLPPHAPVFAARHLAWRDALSEWTPLPAGALDAAE